MADWLFITINLSLKKQKDVLKIGYGRVSLRAHQPYFSVILGQPLLSFKRSPKPSFNVPPMSCFPLFTRLTWYAQCAPMKSQYGIEVINGFGSLRFLPISYPYTWLSCKPA